jgi:hypothetical protein
MTDLPADLLVNNNFLLIPPKIVAIREGMLGRKWNILSALSDHFLTAETVVPSMSHISP